MPNGMMNRDQVAKPVDFGNNPIVKHPSEPLAATAAFHFHQNICKALCWACRLVSSVARKPERPLADGLGKSSKASVKVNSGWHLFQGTNKRTCPSLSV